MKKKYFSGGRKIGRNSKVIVHKIVNLVAENFFGHYSNLVVNFERFLKVAARSEDGMLCFDLVEEVEAVEIL